METLKNLGPIALIALVLLITAFTFFKIPNNLKAALDHVEQATVKIDASMALLNEQKAYLDSVIVANKALKAELEVIKKENDSLAINMQKRFDNAHLYLYDILMKVKKLPEVINDPG